MTTEFSMKVISTLVFFIIFNFVNVHGKPVSSGNNNQTCPKKKEIKLLPGNIDVDMGSLSWMVSNKSKKGLSKLFPKMKSMSSTFSTLKKLGKDKIVERLYFFHKILGDGYGFFGKKKSNQGMKRKTMRIVIQIKALAEILQNNTGCNPGKPGNEFKFNLPKDKPLSGNNSSFLYRFAALLEKMVPEFRKNVVDQLKFT